MHALDIGVLRSKLRWLRRSRRVPVFLTSLFFGTVQLSPLHLLHFKAFITVLSYGASAQLAKDIMLLGEHLGLL